MKKDNLKNKNKVGLVLYTLSILLGVYTLFAVYNSYTYISTLVAQGFVISDELLSVISYYADACMPYFFYSIALGTLGYMVNQQSNLSEQISKINTSSNDDLCEGIIEEYEEAEEEYVIVEEDETVELELEEELELDK